MSRVSDAFGPVKKALKWIVLSGSAVTALSASYVLLQSRQSGDMDWGDFWLGLGYTLGFMVLNTLIYYVHEFKKSK